MKGQSTYQNERWQNVISIFCCFQNRFGAPSHLGPVRVPRWALKSPAITTAVLLLFTPSPLLKNLCTLWNSLGLHQMIGHKHWRWLTLLHNSWLTMRSLLTLRVTGVTESDFLHRTGTQCIPHILCAGWMCHSAFCHLSHMWSGYRELRRASAIQKAKANVLEVK